jgi:hypothetical protein
VRKEDAMRLICALALACLAPAIAAAQPQPGQPPQQSQTPAWSKLPRMQLERQFAGPLQDTIVQRWRDPTDGTLCYIYLPITASHSAPTQSGYVQYGASAIGSISCFPGPGSAPASAQTGQPKRAPVKFAPPPVPIAPKSE